MPTIQIKSRWDSDKILYECEADDLKSAIEKANLNGANLDGANLYGANLIRANLIRANLDGANLIRANLDGANLDGANLDGANLNRANLIRANLYGANLYGANLDGANLDWANLIRANLNGANLDGANLIRANLDGANLDWANLNRANLIRANLYGANLIRANLDGARNVTIEQLRSSKLGPIRGDFFDVLLSAPAEIPALREALVSGQIDGLCYEGKCSCLVGTIAAARHVNPFEMQGLIPDSNRPAERWFLAIKPGDTPENNPFAALAVEWIDRLLPLLDPAIVATSATA